MIPFAAYDRASLRPSVVHVGPGGFHRAHQAVYADTLLRSGERAGAIWAVSLRSSAVRDALARNGFVYHLVERPSGDARPMGRCWGSTSRPRGSSPRWPGSPTRRSRSSPSP